MNIYKKFLSNLEFKKLKSKMMSSNMPWFFNDGVNKEKDGFYQFTFLFCNHKGINCTQEFIDLIQPILLKLKYKKLNAVKANLLLQTNKTIEHGFHTDQPVGTTSIFLHK
tara:strand:+ start:702 stop:1031 length:330 start_codon:yes stop_codon:yes gene_type:complete